MIRLSHILTLRRPAPTPAPGAASRPALPRLASRLAARGAALAVAAVLAACAPTPEPIAPLGPDGLPQQRVYRIAPGDAARVQFRALDSVNTLRSQARLAPLQLNAQLNAAAETHARDMSVQARPWHFGSDGSSPIERVARAGYTGRMKGELISETFESELETINAWMAERDTRAVLMDPEARDIGIAWYQEPNGKLWWTFVTGAPGTADPLALQSSGPRETQDEFGPFVPGVFEPM